MKKITILLVFCSTLVFGQKQGNIWYFGNNAGIDFNTATPTPLTNSALRTLEGCATVANSKGELLFYTDGITVWNKNHLPMSNGTGLLGDTSSTQSAVIVPQPLTPNIFYVFTVDAEGRANGLRYSIVDMSLNGGLGDVKNKNALIKSPMTERITAVRGRNGVIWVVTHGFESSQFLSYRVTSSGLNLTPVISTAGSLHDNSCDAMGYMKISPDGSKLALAVSNCLTPTPVDRVEIFNFNDSTGRVAPLSRPFSNAIPNAYGIEFSPNSRYLYVSAWYQEGKLYQFDLNAQNIAASKKLIGTTIPFGDDSEENCFGALQLAVDGKIYVAKNKQKALGVINKPNETDCDFKDNAFDLDGKTSGLGLPTFIQSYFSVLDVSKFVSKNYCLSTINDTVKFVAPKIVGLKSILWEFGDGDISNKTETFHIYKTFGNYEVKVTIEYVDGSIATFVQSIQIAQGVLPPKNLKTSYGFCENDPIVELDATSETAGVTYEWRNSREELISTNPKIKYSQEDTLSIKITLGSCNYINEIPVARFRFDFGPDRELCQGDSLRLSPGLPSGTVYAWYFQENTTDPLVKVSEASFYVAKKAGIYTLLAGLGRCS